MRTLLLATAFVLAASGAHAAGGKPASADKVGNYVDITTVAVPIVAQGRLINYVFVQVRLNLAPGADALKLRDKEPFLRDALVRSVHRNALGGKADYASVDPGLVKAAVLRDVAPVIGARTVTSVEIVKQAPKQRTGLPRPPA